MINQQVLSAVFFCSSLILCDLRVERRMHLEGKLYHSALGTLLVQGFGSNIRDSANTPKWYRKKAQLRWKKYLRFCIQR